MARAIDVVQKHDTIFRMKMKYALEETIALYRKNSITYMSAVSIRKQKQKSNEAFY